MQKHRKTLKDMRSRNVPIDKLKCGERVTSRIYEVPFQVPMSLRSA